MLLLAVAILVSAAAVFVPATSWTRIATIPQEVSSGTLNDRTVIWGAGLELFRAHAFFGVGAGAFRTGVSHYLVHGIVAHNSFLSILVEQGVVGFGIFAALVISLGFAVKGMPPWPQKLWMVMLAVWLIAASDLTWEMRKTTWYVFGVLIAQWGSTAWTQARGALQRPQWRSA